MRTSFHKVVAPHRAPLLMSYEQPLASSLVTGITQALTDEQAITFEDRGVEDISARGQQINERDLARIAFLRLPKVPSRGDSRLAVSVQMANLSVAGVQNNDPMTDPASLRGTLELHLVHDSGTHAGEGTVTSMQIEKSERHRRAATESPAVAGDIYDYAQTDELGSTEPALIEPAYGIELGNLERTGPEAVSFAKALLVADWLLRHGEFDTEAAERFKTFAGQHGQMLLLDPSQPEHELALRKTEPAFLNFMQLTLDKLMPHLVAAARQNS